MNIAVVGAGVSGLVSAHLLGQRHKITLFEPEQWLGGHTHTVEVDGLAIDTGFIVFNDRTYPLFEKFLDQLGVAKRKAQMSFSVTDAQQDLEYNGHTLNTLFAQRRNLLRPQFWQMVWQILRFNKLGTELASSGNIPDVCLGEFLDNHGFDGWMVSHYLLPMGAAIWSASIDDMRRFPLQFFLRFFHHHGLLAVTNRPQWYTVQGGSWQYVKRLQQNPNFALEQGNGVQAVTRSADHVEVVDSQGKRWQFDEVVFACHSDQALALLTDATAAEQAVLGAIRYADNEVILHTDVSQLPQRRDAWASWNYQMGAGADKPVALSYNMNILQGLSSDKTYCVTLNPIKAIKPSSIIGKYRYAHPQFDLAAEAAKARRNEICGVNRSHFCGAYWYSGFHEDGVRSAVDVCRRFGLSL
ncbi:NAD(P)/FAD-dependent oxidoreductase [Ferrimonas lipolytica]|uniref:NAD(P)-binding protein n=1 Tax=Ferrimonas lipolytica TaxID=2724191 RepID=A0A6H1U9F5_9GAMM|nr:FAD-dependent oxidoreductase [Ferrimonas lipolytica]QIZ75677.1 NAD(P)-binding protein [Ferrimonas lipolytica]